MPRDDAFQPDPGHGALFANRKSTDKHPDQRGNACCPFCEKVFDLAAWEKRGKNGKPYLSLSLQEPRERGERPREEPRRRDDDDSPF